MLRGYDLVGAERGGELPLRGVAGTDDEPPWPCGDLSVAEEVDGGDDAEAECARPNDGHGVFGSIAGSQCGMESTGHRFDHDGVVVIEGVGDTEEL